MLTKEQYEILKKNEKHLKSAQSGYVRGLYVTDANDLKKIYIDKCNGRDINIHCGSCLLTMCKALFIEMNKYTEKKNEKESNRNTSTKQPKATGKAKADKRTDNSGKK